MDWLEVVYFFGLVIVVVVVQRLWDNVIEKNKRKKAEEEIKKLKTKDMKNEKNEDTKVSTEPEVMLLLTQTLREMKLDIRHDEEDGDFVMTTFQGEYFRIKVENEKFIEVQDLFWYEAPVEDLDNLSMIQKTINLINTTNTFCRMIYSIDEEEKKINLHTLTSLLWIPEIPDLDQYLGSTMTYMLRIKMAFYSRMEILRREQFSERS